MKKLVFFLLFASCIHVESQNTVTIYGSNSCGYTLALKNDITKEGIPFTYCSIDNSSCYSELVAVVKEFNLAKDNYVDLPVVKVTVGTRSWGFVRPSVEQIRSLWITSSCSVENSLVVTPNPVSGVLCVYGAVAKVEIFDITGKPVLFSENETEIDLSCLHSGVYVLKSGNVVKKFIKQ